MRISLRELVYPLGIPLPWRQLISDRKRFLAACGGIVAAVLLMMYQLGLYRAFTEKVVFPHRSFRGDLVLISTNFDYYYSHRPFSIRRLYQAQSYPDVDAVAPVYMAQAQWSVPESGVGRTITLYGIDLDRNPFVLASVQDQLSLLKEKDVVLYDTFSNKDFGPVPRLLTTGREVVAEIEGKRVRVKGEFRMGQTFIGLANTIMSDNGFFTIFPDRPRNVIDFGFINLKPGTDPASARDRLRALLPGDVRVVTMPEFLDMERQYWLKKSPIGFILVAGMLLAMCVGAAIVYQILYTDVSDHLKEYATLKALGVGDGFFARLVIKQALILLVIGFPPAILLTNGLYFLTRQRAQYPVFLTWERTALVFIFSFIMCIIAGAMATRKLRNAEPAEIFHG